jgi:lipopolysaccharide export system protein LptA
MRFLRVVGVVVLVLCTMAIAAENLGIHNVANVSFETAVRVGTTVIPAGAYTIRHAMEGQDHVMTFTRTGKKDVYKVRCTLVALGHKAGQDQQLIEISGNERVLRELVFRGDTAKHVF